MMGEYVSKWRYPAQPRKEPVNTVEIDLTRRIFYPGRGVGDIEPEYDRVSGKALVVGEPVDLGPEDVALFEYKPEAWFPGMRVRFIVIVDESS